MLYMMTALNLKLTFMKDQNNPSNLILRSMRMKLTFSQYICYNITLLGSA